MRIAGLRRSYPAADPPYELRVGGLELPRAARMGLMGPTGSGKSTLVEVLGLLAIPQRIDAFDLAAPPRPPGPAVRGDDPGADGAPTDLMPLLRPGRDAERTRLRAARIAFLLQDGGLLPYLDVRANAVLAMRLARPGRPVDHGRIAALAEAIGIGGLLHRAPATLSGGQRRRAAVLRALAPGVDLLICDEPTTGLDEETARDVMDVIERAALDAGASVLVVSHDGPLLEAHGYDVHRMDLHVSDGVVRARLLGRHAW